MQACYSETILVDERGRLIEPAATGAERKPTPLREMAWEGLIGYAFVPSSDGFSRGQADMQLRVISMLLRDRENRLRDWWAQKLVDKYIEKTLFNDETPA